MISGGGGGVRRNAFTTIALACGDWRMQTTKTTPALNTSVLRGVIAMITKLSIVSMMNAPISEPAKENRPPANEVPPITTARMASNSMNKPIEFGSAEVEFDVSMSPARPAQKEQKM